MIMDIGDGYGGHTYNTGHDVNHGMSTSFVPEILLMMQSFGDGPKCNPGSAHLIEEVVRTQMNSSLIQCYEIAKARRDVDAGVVTIGLPEILFLMRRDIVKSVRLLRHLNLKDTLSSSTSSSAAATTSLASAFDANLVSLADDETQQQHQQWQSIPFLSSSDGGNTFTTSSLLTPTPMMTPKQKRRESRLDICINFLKSIDDTNQVINLYSDEDFIDTIKLNRNIRIERLTRGMSNDEYLKFSSSRSVSFGSKKGNILKFKNWLLNNHELIGLINIDNYAMDALQWLAHELVAQIVDYCFLVQSEKKKMINDDVIGLISCKKNNLFTTAGQQHQHSCLDGLNQGVKRKLSSTLDEETPLNYYGSISPQDVREVTRRYFTNCGQQLNVFRR